MTLKPLPDAFADTREALHDIAARVISPQRQAVTGRIGLRSTPGGFGTPPFGDEERRIRVDGDELVTEENGREVAREPLDRPVDVASSRALGDWYAFGNDVFEELRGDEESLIQLWPEHFDIAIELGDEAAGSKATYGASPGDENHPEPYLYIAPWGEIEPSDYWNASGFKGAELNYPQLLAAADQRAAALEFFRSGAAQLAERGQ